MGYGSVASGEGSDRAGGFAVQGLGGHLVRRIDGDYNNVVSALSPALTLSRAGPQLGTQADAMVRGGWTGRLPGLCVLPVLGQDDEGRRRVPGRLRRRGPEHGLYFSLASVLLQQDSLHGTLHMGRTA